MNPVQQGPLGPVLFSPQITSLTKKNVRFSTQGLLTTPQLTFMGSQVYACLYKHKKYTLYNTQKCWKWVLMRNSVSSHFSNSCTGISVWGSRKVSVAQSCPSLYDPMDCSLPGSSVHGVLQARILEWVTIPFSRGSSNPGIKPGSPAPAGRFFMLWATWEALWVATLCAC